MSDAALPLSEVARVREGTYRLLALLLLPPEPARRERVAALAREIERSDSVLATLGPYLQLRRLLDAALDPAEDQTLLCYDQLFGAGSGELACPPYEASYVGGPQTSAGHISAQLEHTYRGEGLHLSRSLNERPDHAAVELEFMGFLCANEAAAWLQAADERALHAIARERAFIDLHLGCWIGAFAQRMRAATTRRLYAAIADALDAVVQHDRDLTVALMTQIEELHREQVTC